MTEKKSQFTVLENVIFLKKTPLFSPMKTGELRAIAVIAEEIVVSAGEDIVTEGDLGDAMYIIKKGSVTISRKSGATERVDLASLSAGECFGDMAIFNAEVRSATVSAHEPCVLLRLDSDSVIDVIAEYPTLAIQLLKIFVQRLRTANATIEHMAHVSEHEQK